MVGLVPAAAWVALPFSIGLARHLAADARSRARADADERLVQAERLRIAQEVHDVVGHGLAAIQMQADIALHVRDTRPGQSEEALRAISAASAEALDELRSTLSSIRPDGTDASQDPVAPTPGIARIGALCERVRTAGVAVDLEIDPAAGPLPPAADVAVYRIVQESLTNVVKHSAHPRAEVRIRQESEAVEVTVTNQDLHPAGHEPGFGISGMRHRAARLGGTLTAGAGPEPHTFHVHAVLPLASPSPEEQP
nr:histidine kinase [Brachybacterium sacelli]